MKNLSTKNIYSIALASLILGMLFNYLFYDKIPGISFPIYIALIVAGLYGLFSYFKISYNKFSVYYLPPILFFSLMTSVFENSFLLFWNLVLTMGLLLLVSSELIGKSVRNFLFSNYIKTAALLPLRILGKALNALIQMLLIGKNVKNKQNVSQIIKGILITIPIALFFFSLLSSADLAFEQLVSSIFNFNFDLDPNLVSQIWLTGIVALVLLGSYVYILENVGEVTNIETAEKIPNYKLGNIEAGILFTTLNVIFLTFVIIQVKYLFAGHNAIFQLGFTYAEYAHKGFAELIIVALLTFVVIFLAEKYIVQTNNQTSLVFRTLTNSLIVLVLVIMASAFIRLNIYEHAYGFTLLRILVQAFIIWLAGVFLWLSYKLIFKIQEHTFIFGIFLSVITFFIFFNLINPDALVARKNIAQFAQTGNLDTNYLSDLSADAIPTLLPLLEMSNAKDKYGNSLPKKIATELKKYYDSIPPQPWESYNYSRNRALNLIETNWETITKLAE
jgi:hypothetical protein